jgi:hypothetical protein
MYYIYHIPNYVYADGSIGKIGATSDLEYRIKRNKRDSLEPFDNWEILEEWDCKFKVSEREIELQKQYGYKVDTKPYWKSIEIPTKQGCIKGGKTQGKKMVESGMIYKISNNKLRSKAGKIGGKVSSIWNREQMQELAKKNRKPIYQYDLNGNFIKEWKSMVECAKHLNGTKVSISRCCRGKQKTAYGFIFKFKENHVL